jgi:hypothetical protein
MAWHGMAWPGMAWHGMAWHGINNLESMEIPNERWHQFQALNHLFLPIGGLISIWQPDHLMI